MSLREYLRPSDDILFVSDLLRNAKTNLAASSAHSLLPAGQVPRAANMYDRIRERQQAIENELWNIDSKKRAAEQLEAEAAACTKRHELRAKKAKLLEASSLRREIEHVESGAKMQEFLGLTQPYIREYQKQQFCRTNEPSEDVFAVASKESQVLDDFLSNVEGQPPKFQIQSSDVCASCSEPLQLHQTLSMLICPRCGAARPFLDATASLLAYSDDYDYSSFSYKRINHFCEWLSSIQAKETLELPESVLQSIMQRLYDERIQTTDEITPHKVREVLKKLKLRKYYEHVQLITCKITGRPAPKMTPEMEERIKVCFLAASSAFQRRCPPDRKNMISYATVTGKLCELLGYTEFLPFFTPLKSREKMAKADACWRLICEDLNWTFTPSLP